MWQQVGNEFITLLNSLYTGNVSNVKLLESREISIEKLGNGDNVLFEENYLKNPYNFTKLKTLQQ